MIEAKFMGYPAKKETGYYTYTDYITWSEDQRYELIEGVIYDMSPAPSVRHQTILGELFRQISNYLVGKTCKVFMAPFDVRFLPREKKTDEIRTVVQPDIVIICDKTKIDAKGGIGAPDLIIEIVSPGSLKKDMQEKFTLYENEGVQEYWVVYPFDRFIMVFGLGESGRYGHPMIYSESEHIKVGIFEDLIIDLKSVFQEDDIPR
jgi:Uma2 family endonuclease